MIEGKGRGGQYLEGYPCTPWEGSSAKATKRTRPAEDLVGLAQCTRQGLTVGGAGAAAAAGGGVVDSQKSKSSP